MADLPRLKQVLDHEELHWLIERLRKRLERGEALVGTVSLPHPTPAQRQAFDRLLGRPASRSASLHMPLERLEQILQNAELCRNLTEAIEALTGADLNRRAAETAQRMRWTQLFETAEAEADGAALSWVHDIRHSGLLLRLSKSDLSVAQRLLNQARSIIQDFPYDGVPLAELAAKAAGDSHALDQGQPLGTLVLRAAALIGKIKLDHRSESRRAAWANVGVLCDELSGPVLLLNVREDSDSYLAQVLRLHADHGEPYRLTIRQLLRLRPRWSRHQTGPVVYICENPTVLATTANRIGPTSAPLICTEGSLRVAAQLLLRQLSDAGIELRYHGDFDWPGIQIANGVIERFGANPWRMAPQDYLSAPGSKLLRGKPVVASWSAALTIAMQRRGLAIDEEGMTASLLEDLQV